MIKSKLKTDSQFTSNSKQPSTYLGNEAPMIAKQITDDCLYAGLFGNLGDDRMHDISDHIALLLDKSDIKIVIIDLGNVNSIDSKVSDLLVKLADIVSLLGVIPIYCGISPYLGKSMVQDNVNLGIYSAVKDLKHALAKSYTLCHKQVVTSTS